MQCLLEATKFNHNPTSFRRFEPSASTPRESGNRVFFINGISPAAVKLREFFDWRTLKRYNYETIS